LKRKEIGIEKKDGKMDSIEGRGEGLKRRTVKRIR
jgi:hypothetical protein